MERTGFKIRKDTRDIAKIYSAARDIQMDEWLHEAVLAKAKAEKENLLKTLDKFG